MSFRTAQNKLDRIIGPRDSLYATYKRRANKTVDPLEPNYDTYVGSQIYTSGWEIQRATNSNYSYGGSVCFDLNTFDGLIQDLSIEVDLPDQWDNSGVVEDIEYAPLPALAMIRRIDVTMADRDVHTYEAKELFQLISMANTEKYRKLISKKKLGGYCVTGGNQYVTKPGKIMIPFPIEGTSLEYGKHLWNEYTPLAINKILGRVRIEIHLRDSDYVSNAGSAATPTNMILRYKRMAQAKDRGNPTDVVKTAQPDLSSEVIIPTREYRTYKFDRLNFRNDAILDVPITNIKMDAELITLLIHITDVDQDNTTQRKYFDFEEIESITVLLGNDVIYEAKNSHEFELFSLDHYRLDTRVIGSTAPASENIEDAKYMVQIPISEHDYLWRDAVGQGTNPRGVDLTLQIKTKNTFTGNILITALYRALLVINPGGTVTMLRSPQSR